MSVTEAIALLRELRAKATAGEWFEDSQRVQDSDRRDYYYNIYAPNGRIIADTLNSDMVLLEDNGDGVSLDVVGQANAAAIVAAMNSLESLLECASLLAEFIGPDSVAHEDTILERKARAALDALGKVGGA